MNETVAIVMFPALFALVFLGLPVSFSLIVVSVVCGYAVFGDMIMLQLYGPLLSSASNFILASIPLFILMGALLERSGIALRLYEALQMWMGQLRGGLSVATITMCALFAASSGVVGAVEIVVGLMAIPAMMKYAYNKGLIAGTICAGGSLGTIIPPSVIVIVYSSIAQLSIGDLFAASIIPGLLMVAFFLGYVLIRCWLQPSAGPQAGRETTDIPLALKIWYTVTAVLPAVALIITVLGSLLAGIASPTEAAAVGVLGALILSFGFRTLSPAMLGGALETTIRINAMIMLIVVGGTMFTSTFSAAGGGRMVADLTETLGLDGYGLILFLLLIVFIAGFVMDWISIVLICVPIFTPLIKAAGIDEVWFAIMMLVVIQTSYLTPPMAPSIFYLRSVAPSEMNYGDMYRGVMPFVAMQLLVLLAVMIFPSIATYLPDVLVGL